MIDKDGMQAWEICGLCHNADGISRMSKFPKLAGQKASYISTQVLAFREGLRANDGGQMQAITNEIDVADVKKIAMYFSSLEPDTQLTPPSGDEVILRMVRDGKALFHARRDGFPACASCHIDPISLAPWLDGQHENYLKKQLYDFRSGDRAVLILTTGESGESSVPPTLQRTMTEIAEGLTDKEIEALALYLGSVKFERK